MKKTLFTVVLFFVWGGFFICNGQDHMENDMIKAKVTIDNYDSSVQNGDHDPSQNNTRRQSIQPMKINNLAFNQSNENKMMRKPPQYGPRPVERGVFQGYCNFVRDIPYKNQPQTRGKYAQGPGANFSKLDVYHMPGDKNKPVVVFVHGGGWTSGDKSNLYKNDKLLNFFIENGFVLVSVNFRLLLNKNDPQATYKDQANDIAESLKWVSKNIKEYGGNPEGVILFGYSSGAHLVSLLGTDKRYLSRQGMSIDFIKAVIAMDVHAYDIAMALAMMPDTALEEKIPFMKSIFTENRAGQDDASPINFISSEGNTRFLIISAGMKEGRAQNVSQFVSKLFADNLRQAGHHAIHVHFENRSHVSLVLGFGHENDGVSIVINRFLNTVKKTAF